MVTGTELTLKNRSLKELEAMLSRCELDLRFLMDMMDATDGLAKKNYMDSYYKEERLRRAIEEEIDRRDN